MSDPIKSPGCCMPTAPKAHCTSSQGSGATIPFSNEGMVQIGGEQFLMGAIGPETWPGDGEGPVRPVAIDTFWIDACAVTNKAFGAFVDATGYATEAEHYGWSFVHDSQISRHKKKSLSAFRIAGLEWWYRINGANWRIPLGFDEDVEKLRLWDHPAVHISWNDADAFARWGGKRLPTEAEWEYACRGGREGLTYPWGNELTPGGKHQCNIWQGGFPAEDRGDDGYKGTAPSRSFKPNGYGLYNMAGNVWEWTNDWFSPIYALSGIRENPKGPAVGERKVMRGGSYLCHASYCNRYRCSARTSNTSDSSSGHLGFRCAASA